MNRIKFYFITLIVSMSVSSLYAQDINYDEGNAGETKSEAVSSGAQLDISADLVNRCVWRGMLLGNSPNFQSTISINSADGNFSAGAWGTSSFNGDYAELDLFALYTYKYVTLTVYDYFTVNEAAPSNKYFNYDKDVTSHLFETILTLGGFSIPLEFSAGVLVYGADKNSEGENNYSMYFEASYGFNIGQQDFTIFTGFTPKEGLYAPRGAIVNIGCKVSKTISITDKFKLPLYGSLMVNPDTQNIFLVCGLTI